MPSDCKYFQLKKGIKYMYGEDIPKTSQEFAQCTKALEFGGILDPCPLYLSNMNPEKECPFFRERPKQI